MGVLNIDLNSINLDKKFWWRWSWFYYILIISEFRRGILNLKNGKHFKNDKWRINASSVAS